MKDLPGRVTIYMIVSIIDRCFIGFGMWGSLEGKKKKTKEIMLLAAPAGW